MNNKLNIGILLSIVSMGITIYINYLIAVRYEQATGKTKALFGLTEMLQFGYQYYVLLPCIAALILIITSRAQAKRKFTYALLPLIAIILVFVRLWRLFV